MIKLYSKLVKAFLVKFLKNKVVTIFVTIILIAGIFELFHMDINHCLSIPLIALLLPKLFLILGFTILFPIAISHLLSEIINPDKINFYLSRPISRNGLINCKLIALFLFQVIILLTCYFPLLIYLGFKFNFWHFTLYSFLFEIVLISLSFYLVIIFFTILTRKNKNTLSGFGFAYGYTFIGNYFIYNGMLSDNLIFNKISDCLSYFVPATNFLVLKITDLKGGFSVSIVQFIVCLLFFYLISILFYRKADL